MARITQQSSIHTTGISYENEPTVKSDGASSDVMEWAASTGSSVIKVTEGADNKLDLTVDGKPVVAGVQSDGAGLHLQSGGKIELTNGAAQFGTGDFSIEFVLNQEKENTSESYIYVTHTSGHNRLLIFHDVSDDNLVLDFRNASSASTKKDLAYDMNQDFGSPTHYVITFDRDGLATLYKNGNSVASVDISSTSAIDIGTDSSGSRIGTGSTDGVIGTFYRFRTWNKLVDAKALFERADVDFADQYGSQTETSTNSFVNSGFAGFSGNAAGFTTTGSANGNVAYKNQTFTGGKKYRLKFTIADGNSSNLLLLFRSSTGGAGSNVGTIESTNLGSVVSDTYLEVSASGNYELIVSNLGSAQSMRFFTGGDVGAINISAFSIVQIGCVSDYDLAFANENQSRMVADRSTNNVDGEMSSSGVKQTQVIKQLNSTAMRVGGTSATAATPADNQLIVGAGSGLAQADADDIILTGGSSVNAGITFNTPSAGGYLYFADGDSGDDLYRGFIKYVHSGNAMEFGTDAVSRLAISSTGQVNITGTKSFPETSEHPLLVQAGMANGLSNRYIKLQQTYTGSAKDGIPIVWETNADGSNNKSYGYIRTKADGTVAIGNKAAGAAVAVGTALGTTEHLAIDSSGNVGIGNVSPASLLHIAGDTNDNGGELILQVSNNNTTDNIGTIRFGNNISSNLSMIQSSTSVNNTTSDLSFHTSATGTQAARMTISSTGLCTFSDGIAFQSATTGSGTGVGYTLDAYEYGTWTPTLPNGGTLTTDMKTYTRIGNLCTVHFYVSSIAPSATSSRFEIGGLPFTISNDTNYYPAGTIGYCGDGDFHDCGLVGLTDANSVYFHVLDGASGWLSNNQIISRFSGSTDALICTLTYKVK